MMRSIIPLVWCLFVSACGGVEPAYTIELLNDSLLDPIPTEYPGWYLDVESCLAQLGDFDTITWYVADEVFLNGEQKAGIIKFPNKITMWADAIYIQSSVKHEMIHHVLQRTRLHGTDAFDRCS